MLKRVPNGYSPTYFPSVFRSQLTPDGKQAGQSVFQRLKNINSPVGSPHSGVMFSAKLPLVPKCSFGRVLPFFPAVFRSQRTPDGKQAGQSFFQRLKNTISPVGSPHSGVMFSAKLPLVPKCCFGCVLCFTLLSHCISIPAHPRRKASRAKCFLTFKKH